MFVVCLIVALLLIVLVYYKEREIYNPTVFFIGFYGITGFVSGLHILGMYSPTDYVYLIVLVSIFFFFTGYLVSNRIKVFSTGVFRREIRLNLYRILVYGSLIFGIIKFITILPLMRRGVSLDYIRTVYNGQTVQGVAFSSLIYQIEVYFCKPCIQLIIPVFCVLITNRVLRKSIPISVIVLSAISILINQVVSGGRVLIFSVIILILASLKLQYGIKVKDQIFKNIKIFVILALLVFLMYWISIQRGSSQLLNSVFYYFCAPLVGLSENLGSIVGTGAARSYGLALVSGFIRPLYVILRNIFGLRLQNIDIIYDLHREVNVYFQIGQNTTFNAFVTLLYYFYLDGGLFGVAFDSFIYSAFCNKCYNSMKRNMDSFHFVLYLLVFQNLMLSFIRYQYIDVGNALAFVYLLLIYRRTNQSLADGALE